MLAFWGTERMFDHRRKKMHKKILRQYMAINVLFLIVAIFASILAAPHLATITKNNKMRAHYDIPEFCTAQMPNQYFVIQMSEGTILTERAVAHYRNAGKLLASSELSAYTVSFGCLVDLSSEQLIVQIFDPTLEEPVWFVEAANIVSYERVHWEDYNPQ